ncbi:MAG: hypothetical protein RIR00_2392 [Pseudomonadota bacterium]|jgi:hypothetical protein
MPLALLYALAASLSLHGIALFGPEVTLPHASEVPVLEAELQPPAAPAAPSAPPRPAKKKPEPKVKRESLPLPAVAEGEPLASPQTASPETAAPVAEPAVPPLAEAAAATPAPAAPPLAGPGLSGKGQISYVVYRGEQGFEIGRSRHEWQIGDGAYRLYALTETSGLVALLKSIRVELESEGRLGEWGLQPERFSVRRNGNSGETARFDWQHGQVRLGGDGGPLATAEPGAQDLLSFNYQFAFVGSRALDMGVATGKKYERYHFEDLGSEAISTPAGTFRARHLRAAAAGTELWLAEDPAGLPLRIIHTDNKGDRYEQVVTTLQTESKP